MEQNIETTMTPERTEKKQRFLLALFLALAATYNFFIYNPIEAYITNADDFWFEFSALLPAIVLFSILSFAVIFLLIRLLPKKASAFVSAIVFSFTLSLYIEYNFLVTGYPIMDGGAVNWSSLADKGTLSTVIWVVLIAIALLAALWKTEIFRKVVTFLSGVLLGMLVVSTVSLFVASPPAGKSNVGLSSEDMYSLSQEENILVVVSDTFESSYFARALEEDPSLKDDFKDFIYYHDTTGVSTFTNLSLPVLFTGEDIEIGKYPSTAMIEAYAKSDFFDAMHSNGYDVRYYTRNVYMDQSELGKVDNLIEAGAASNASATVRVSELMYRFTMFKCMPHYLKQFFTVDTADFTDAQKLVSEDLFVQDDEKFLADITENGFPTASQSKQYIVYHLKGVHAPYNTDRNFKSVKYGSSTPLEDRRYEKSLSQIKIFKEIIAQLKKSGAYENTTIIFTADHGNLQRYNPLFLVKPENADSAFRESAAQVSLLEDYVPFIEELSSGRSFEDTKLGSLSETAERVRTVYNYDFATSYGTSLVSRSVVEVKGKAYDDSSYVTVRDEFAESAAKDKYSWGSAVELTPHAANAVVCGIHDDATPGSPRYAYSKTALVSLTLDSAPDRDLSATIDIAKVWTSSQRLVVSVGGTVVFDEAVAQGTPDVTFTIPKELVPEASLRLDFEFPDRIQNPVDTETLASFYDVSFNFNRLVIE